MKGQIPTYCCVPIPAVPLLTYVEGKSQVSRNNLQATFGQEVKRPSVIDTEVEGRRKYLSASQPKKKVITKT